ncbi:hypothetical protein TSUD_241770 [Trifolium subterraneum]|uniref:Uncharacterized protein n=1 Tax=Trifolium subterraneum TaxID=3900 RepID=A0A2Z6NIT0_TRISU|nr:hypothetical protein TSUD_241770 [Trifolium subterraneum]
MLELMIPRDAKATLENKLLEYLEKGLVLRRSFSRMLSVKWSRVCLWSWITVCIFWMRVEMEESNKLLGIKNMC